MTRQSDWFKYRHQIPQLVEHLTRNSGGLGLNHSLVLYSFSNLDHYTIIGNKIHDRNVIISDGTKKLLPWLPLGHHIEQCCLWQMLGCPLITTDLVW